jgi:cytochrome c553
MKLLRPTLLLALLATLAACGDSTKEPAEPAAAPVTADVAPPAPPPPAAELAAEASDGDGGDAVYARTCAACHGATAQGMGDFPSLAKLSKDAVRDRLKAYQAGTAVGPKSAIMIPVAKKLSDQQIEALSSYLGN